MNDHLMGQSADAVLAEALARVEYKLDLLLRNLGAINAPLMSRESNCPACTKDFRYLIDTTNGMVVRSCGCSTGLFPMKLQFNPELEKEIQDGENRIDPDTD